MGEWEDRAQQAAERRNRMDSFGPYTYGLLVEGKYGLFAVDPEDAAVTGQLLNHGVYNEEELDLASSLIAPQSEVLVVGTHIGALAVPLSKRCRHLDVVEANPKTQKLLEINLRLNYCANVTLHRMAASDRREKINFLINRENSGGSKRQPIKEKIYYVYDKPEVVEVNAYPLDEILGEKAYDLIFMDIEGSEYFALKGMQHLLSKAKVLDIEFFPHHLNEVAGVGPDEFADQIEPYFEWMYVPRDNILVKKNDIKSKIMDMYDGAEGHDGIYFMKTIDPAWIAQHGLTMEEL